MNFELNDSKTLPVPCSFEVAIHRICYTEIELAFTKIQVYSPTLI